MTATDLALQNWVQARTRLLTACRRYRDSISTGSVPAMRRAESDVKFSATSAGIAQEALERYGLAATAETLSEQGLLDVAVSYARDQRRLSNRQHYSRDGASVGNAERLVTDSGRELLGAAATAQLP